MESSHGEAKTYLAREALLALADVTYKDVWVPQWKTWVRLRSLSGTQRDRFEASLQGRQSANGKVAPARNLDNIRARLLVLTIVDPNNNDELMFSKPEDVAALGAKNAEPLSDLFREACLLSGITKEDQEKLEKNSGEADGDLEVTS